MRRTRGAIPVLATVHHRGPGHKYLGMIINRLDYTTQSALMLKNQNQRAHATVIARSYSIEHLLYIAELERAGGIK